MDDVTQQLAPHLLGNETLVWTGRPDPAKHFAASDVFLVPFSILWCGFAIFWETLALRLAALFPFALFGVPFIAGGLYFTVGRFLYKTSRNRRTVYGLTQRRALVSRGPGSLSEVPLQQVPIDQTPSRDGRHLTVTFGVSTRIWAAGPSYPNTGMEFFSRGGSPLAFYDVPAAAGLESALRGIAR